MTVPFQAATWVGACSVLRTVAACAAAAGPSAAAARPMVRMHLRRKDMPSMVPRSARGPGTPRCPIVTPQAPKCPRTIGATSAIDHDPWSWGASTPQKARAPSESTRCSEPWLPPPTWSTPPQSANS